jgi:hypothetical protein
LVAGFTRKRAPIANFVAFFIPGELSIRLIMGPGLRNARQREETGEAAQGRGRLENYGASRKEAFFACDCLRARRWACHLASRVCTPFQNSGRRFWYTRASGYHLIEIPRAVRSRAPDVTASPCGRSACRNLDTGKHENPRGTE